MELYKLEITTEEYNDILSGMKDWVICKRDKNYSTDDLVTFLLHMKGVLKLVGINMKIILIQTILIRYLKLLIYKKIVMGLIKIIVF